MSIGARSKTLRLYAEGSFAMFTCPAFAVEKVSFDVMTPTAAQGLVGAICWKPAVHIDVRRICVCRPIRRQTMAINGCSEKMRVPSLQQLRGEESLDSLQRKPTDRLQTRHVVLRDVAYLVDFEYVMTDRAGPGETPRKFEEIFSRRLERGEFHRLPHFGQQQYVAFCRPARDSDSPINETRSLGALPHFRVYGEETADTLWFHAVMNEGVIEVPSAWDRMQG